MRFNELKTGMRCRVTKTEYTGSYEIGDTVIIMEFRRGGFSDTKYNVDVLHTKKNKRYYIPDEFLESVKGKNILDVLNTKI